MFLARRSRPESMGKFIRHIPLQEWTNMVATGFLPAHFVELMCKVDDVLTELVNEHIQLKGDAK